METAPDDFSRPGTEAVSVAAGDLATAWARIRGRLRQEVGDVEYRTWLRQMTLGGIEDGTALVSLPTRFLRDWVRDHYGDRLRLLVQAEMPGLRGVELRVASARPATAEAAAPAAEMPLAESLLAPPAPPVPAMPAAAAGNGAGGNEWVAPLDPRYTFDTFVVGKPNEFAHACARRVAEAPAVAGFNPLFLYGGVGLGKTHLMHAIAWALREGNPQLPVAYMSAEKFMYRFIAALRSHNTTEFKTQLRSVQVLMVDDLQFLIGKDNTQEEFFHTFNALIDAGKQIILSADKAPTDLSGIEDRLRTRLSAGIVADLHATTYELRLSILQAKAHDAGVEIPPRVLELLARKIASNVRDLEGALNRIVAHAQLFGRPITLETAPEVLADILRSHDRKLSIDDIQRKVAEHYNMRLTEMASARRSRAVARPRQVAMFLSKQLTQRSLPEIGRKFGNRDHTTVLHAVNKVTELMEADAAFAEEVTLIRKMLET
ncbi:chromosomal replication initiator protein DnaA [Sabulicella glaciei]|uniref:Chromosomal replication initiator protein DnaA n=1 Tax=Sabulicella glaciei TaxID=2984948 RepID=A0ABT3NWJ8_9PROT|nr:chromosomal replication initiator protein DnaA [Roseococcus sp. MDT2-1-1]MCW8086510.1 chromosomal replication initiator protein DnaA [Roseococcus sp. MDT2-1-1]